MKRLWKFCAVAALLLAGLVACGQQGRTVKLGASFGVGAAARWDFEAQYMQERAEDLGAEIEIRMNRDYDPASQEKECIELLDSGIDVLILIPRDAGKVSGILEYAKQKDIPVISYARVVLEQPVDLFVGYDCERIGQRMGQYLSEAVFEGTHIWLQGDANDANAVLLHAGAMRYLKPLQESGSIRVLLDEVVQNWDPENAKELVRQALEQSNNKVDAILAPNDAIAGACAQVLEERGVETPVIITGMDTELDAVKRIVAGTQSMTMYMDLKELAHTAVNEAVHMARGEDVVVNAQFDNRSESTIPSNLITGQVVTKENLDRVLIDGGYYTRDEIYGS